MKNRILVAVILILPFALFGYFWLHPVTEKNASAPENKAAQDAGVTNALPTLRPPPPAPPPGRRRIRFSPRPPEPLRPPACPRRWNSPTTPPASCWRTCAAPSATTARGSAAIPSDRKSTRLNSSHLGISYA